MKHILFMAINMNIGGMEKALLSMISEIPLDKYKVTVLMLEKYGGFLKDIPKGINIEFLDLYKDIKKELNSPPIPLAIQYIKNNRITRGLNILALHIITKLIKDRSLYFKYLLKNYNSKDEIYDIAVAYAGPNDFISYFIINKVKAKKKVQWSLYFKYLLKNYNSKDEIYDIAVAYAGPNDFISYFIINKVKAKKKVQWIHFDVTKIGFNLRYSTKIYKKFDKIFVVSKEAKDKLASMIPVIRSKIDVFSNIVSEAIIKEKAKKGKSFEDKFDGIRILTVGRLSKEKGQDITIPVLAKLRAEGYNVRWYCLGEGSLRSECEKLIREYNVENDYILLGSSQNPYGYMRDCDLYVQPSRHEGYCITLAEARCFNNPIVTTNFTGAKEQINENMNGLIVNINEKDIYINIKKLLDDKLLFQSIKINLNKRHISNTDEINKLFNILE